MGRRLTAPPAEPVTESYLESLSDLLVGLLFIFIIVLMSFSLDLRVAQDASRSAERQRTDLTQRRNDLLRSMRTRMGRDGVLVDIDLRNGILRLPESLLFDSGSAEFTARGRAKVAVVARELALELPCYSRASRPQRSCPPESHPVLDAVFIEGHTDNVPITGGPFKDNWELSEARSRRTYQALLEAAPSLSSVRNVNNQPLLSISAYGDTRPLDGFGSAEENQKRSRRIDLRFIVGSPNQ